MKTKRARIATVAMGLTWMMVGMLGAQTRYDISRGTLDEEAADADVLMLTESSSELGLTFNVGKTQLRPYLGLWAGYDNNLFMQSEGAGTSDWYFAVAPGISVRYGMEDYVSVDYSHEWYFYDEHDTEDYDSDVFEAGVHIELPRTSFHIEDTLRDTTGADYERAERLSRFQNTLNADVEREVSRKTSVALRGSYQINDYKSIVEGGESAASAFIDYDVYEVAGRGYYSVFPKTDVYGELAYGWVDPDQPGSAFGNYANANYEQVSVGVRGRLTAKTVLTGRVGYQHRAYTGDIDDMDTWTTKGTLMSKVREWLMMGVQISRHLYPSAAELGTTLASSRVSPFVRYDFWGDRFTLSGNGTYERIDFHEAAGESPREDAYWHLLAMLDWNLGEHVILGVGYLYSENDSNEDVYDIDRSQMVIRAFANY